MALALITPAEFAVYLHSMYFELLFIYLGKFNLQCSNETADLI